MTIYEDAYNEMLEDGEFDTKSIQKHTANQLSTYEVLDTIGLPDEAIYLGWHVDSYGGGVLAGNLFDQNQNPICFVGNNGASKTDFLKMVALGVEYYRNRGTMSRRNVEFAVLTNNLENWDNFSKMSSCAAVIPMYADICYDFLFGVSSWATHLESSSRLVLLVDNLLDVSQLDFDVVQEFKCIVRKNIRNKVFVVSAVSAGDIEAIDTMLNLFPCRFYGNSSLTPQVANSDFLFLTEDENWETGIITS